MPYYDRGAIEAGVLDGQKLEICWLKDPLDVFAIQLEGSGRGFLRTVLRCASTTTCTTGIRTAQSPAF